MKSIETESWRLPPEINMYKRVQNLVHAKGHSYRRTNCSA